MMLLLKNPVFRREFTANSRCVKTLVMTLALLSALAGVLVALWPRTGVFSQTNSNEIFSVFLNLNLGLIILIIPAFVSTTVTIERENNSYELLFTSLLRPREILFGKLFSSLAVTFLVVLTSMPVTAVCALSGGISVPLLTKAYAVILLATLTYGMLGLAVSSMCHRSFTALVITYIGILILAGAVWLPSVLLNQLADLRGIWHSIRALSPFEVLLALNHPERYELAGTGIDSAGIFALYVRGMVLLAFLFLLIFCRYVLRPSSGRKGREIKAYTDLRTGIRRRLGFPFYLIDPQRRKRPIAMWRNPVFVAEIRSRVFGHPKVLARSLSVCVVLSMFLLFLVALQFATALEPDTVRVAAILFQCGIVAFFAPAVCAGSITDEAESGTLVLLRMTGIRVRTVVLGKMKAGLLYTLVFLAASLPVMWALAYLEADASYLRVAACIAVLIVSTLLFVAAGLCASTILPGTASATAVSYGFSALLCVGAWGILLFGDRVSPGLRALILSLSPPAAALQVSCDLPMFDELPSLFGRPLWLNHLVLMGMLTLALAGVAAYRVRFVFRHRV